MIKGYVDKVQSLLQRQSFKKILRSIQYLSSERLIKLVVGLVIHAWLARYLGPEKFGKLSYVVNYTAIFLPFVTFGLDDVLTKNFLEKKFDAQDIVTSQIYLRLKFALAGYVFLSVIVLFDPELEWNYKLMLIIFGATLFIRVLDVLEVFYQAFLQLKPVFWARNVGYLSGAGLKALGIMLKTNLSYFVFTYIVETFFWKLLSIISYLKTNRIGKINKAHLTHFLKESWPLFWGAFIIMLDYKLGYLTLKKIKNDESVGNFSIVSILIELWNFLPAAICASLYPAIYNAKVGLSGSYKNRVQLVYDFLVWLGLAFAISVTFASPIVVKILYGNKFPELDKLLALGSWLAILSFLSFGRIKYYALEGKLNVWVIYSLVSLIINFTAQMYLIPIYDERGVFISMLVSPYISLVLCALFSSFVRKELVMILNCLLAPKRWLIR